MGVRMAITGAAGNTTTVEITAIAKDTLEDLNLAVNRKTSGTETANDGIINTTNSLDITFDTTAGASYQVSYRTRGGANLQGDRVGEWTTIGNAVTGTGIPYTLNWTGLTAQRQNYDFRVIGTKDGFDPVYPTAPGYVSQSGLGQLTGHTYQNYAQGTDGNYFAYFGSAQNRLPGEIIEVYAEKDNAALAKVGEPAWNTGTNGLTAGWYINLGATNPATGATGGGDLYDNWTNVYSTTK
jgi:hypothetical protein